MNRILNSKSAVTNRARDQLLFMQASACSEDACVQLDTARWLFEGAFSCWRPDWAIKGLVFSVLLCVAKQPTCLFTVAMTGQVLVPAATQALHAVRSVPRNLSPVPLMVDLTTFCYAGFASNSALAPTTSGLPPTQHVMKNPTNIIELVTGPFANATPNLKLTAMYKAFILTLSLCLQL